MVVKSCLPVPDTSNVIFSLEIQIVGEELICPSSYLNVTVQFAVSFYLHRVLFIFTKWPYLFCHRGWSGGAMVLGKLPVPGRPTIWMIVGQEAIAVAVGAGGGCLDISTLLYPFSLLSPSLWETARYRLKYCLKGPLNQTQPTNHCFAILSV